MNPDRSGDQPVRRLIDLARAELTHPDLERAASHADDGLARLEASLAAGRGRGAGRSRRLGFVGLGVAVAAAAAAALATRGKEQLTFTLVGDGATSEAGGQVVSAEEPAEIRFSDGSVVELQRGGRARVAEVARNGARVRVEQGTARVRVAGAKRGRWSFEAGPYTIAVTGTAFDVRWATGEVLDLWLEEGSVMVSGPLIRRGLLVEAGHHFTAHVRDGRVLLDGRAAPGVEQAQPSPEPAAARPPPAPAAATPGPLPAAGKAAGRAVARVVAAPAAGPISWTTRLARGDTRGILDEAERGGLDRTLAAATAGDLGVLADAARYERRWAVARNALLAARLRFPGSRQARDAAFFLGSVAEGEGKGPSAAITWYEVYLRESRDGPYASQALGRKMMLLHEKVEPASARAAASEYLRRHPGGPYAGAARRLVEAP